MKVFITNSVAMRSTIAMGSAMYQLCTNEAIRKLTNETAATVREYGS